MKLLVVDDSKTMRTMLCTYARKLDCTTAEAADGCDALLRLDDSGPFDAALIDWDMPRMNGFDLLKVIRSIREHDHMKIMMVTAQSSFDRVAEALGAGADDYLMKPLDEEMFVDKLRLLGLVV
jgi:two-component system, chemotaxis family, chemotaxis protein CheY